MAKRERSAALEAAELLADFCNIAEGGLCSATSGGAREFLKDICNLANNETLAKRLRAEDHHRKHAENVILLAHGHRRNSAKLLEREAAAIELRRTRK